MGAVCGCAALSTPQPCRQSWHAVSPPSCSFHGDNSRATRGLTDSRRFVATLSEPQRRSATRPEPLTWVQRAAGWLIRSATELECTQRVQTSANTAKFPTTKRSPAINADFSRTFFPRRARISALYQTAVLGLVSSIFFKIFFYF